MRDTVSVIPAASRRRQAIQVLIDESGRLEDRFALWQSDSPPVADELRSGKDDYRQWYEAALRFVPDAERGRFVDMYIGGSFIKRIQAFLRDPLLENPLLQNPSNILPAWMYPFATTFQNSHETQREILQAAFRRVSPAAQAIDELSEVFSRLTSYLDVLRTSGSVNVPAPELHNEYDLQVVVHALLRLMYDDVRAEDPVPNRAGGGSRVDFSLREAGVIIETKMTRKGLADRKIGEELAVDFNRYRAHPDCRGVLALVYDPDRRVRNAAGLIDDLSDDDGSLVTRVLVVR